MTRRQLLSRQATFNTQSAHIRQVTWRGLRQETSKQQEARLRYLLNPNNYGAFFDYYFGKESQVALCQAPSAPFHIDAYERLHKQDIITQVRLWFRGAAKSIQSIVGNGFAQKVQTLSLIHI